ncbi:MAG: mechanosensitive ion channel family protein, partial [Xanthomonadales bacterium]|nr:mechanosensitive ion channel family protein [Xanthomonadales bacterium]
MDMLNTWLADPMARTVGGLLALVLVSGLTATVVRRTLVRGMRKLAARTTWTWDDVLMDHGTLRQFTRIAPTLIIQFGIGFIPGLPPSLVALIRSLALAGTILFLVLALGAALNAIEEVYRRASNGTRSIKTYVQFLKIAIYIIAAVVIVATLIDRSPLILLSGLGALSAILLLVFKDTILGLVAGVQLTSNDMLRVGDWIEVPAAGADGDVIDIA